MDGPNVFSKVDMIFIGFFTNLKDFGESHRLDFIL